MSMTTAQTQELIGTDLAASRPLLGECAADRPVKGDPNSPAAPSVAGLIKPGPARLGLGALVAIAAILIAILAAIPAWKLATAQTKLSRAPGQVAPDFALRDVRTGQIHRLSDHESHVVVIIFCGTHWPMAATYLPRLSAYSADSEMRKIDFVGVYANANESDDAVVEQARKLRVRFPLLKDPDHRLADVYSAEQLGEALVIDRHGRLRYRGAIDDQFDSGESRQKPRRNYLLDAIESVLADKPVSPEVTSVAGPPIERAAEPTKNEIVE
jgi:peroxiredoxin